MKDREPHQRQRTARFGPFELDLRTAELRRSGARVKLQEQPFRVLAFLLERAGDVVTREELRERLWPAEFVDFDHSLNVAVRKLREALGDSAESPRFVETLARRGYRFIAPVSWSGAEAKGSRRLLRSPAAAIAVAALFLSIGAGAFWSLRPQKKSWPANPYAVAILPFTNEDSATQYLSDGMTEILIDTLSRFSGLRVMARSTVFEYKTRRIDAREAGRALHVNAVIAGDMRREAGRYVIHVEMIDVRDGAQLWGNQFTASSATLPAVHTQISDALADHLWQRDKTWRSAHAYPTDPQAFDAYLRGVYAFKAHAIRRALDDFDRAIVRDPEFAAAHAGLSYAVRIASLIPQGQSDANIVAAADGAAELAPVR